MKKGMYYMNTYEQMNIFLLKLLTIILLTILGFSSPVAKASLFCNKKSNPILQ